MHKGLLVPLVPVHATPVHQEVPIDVEQGIHAYGGSPVKVVVYENDELLVVGGEKRAIVGTPRSEPAVVIVINRHLAPTKQDGKVA
jgi:hypothetical protein